MLAGHGYLRRTPIISALPPMAMSSATNIADIVAVRASEPLPEPGSRVIPVGVLTRDGGEPARTIFVLVCVETGVR